LVLKFKTLRKLLCLEDHRLGIAQPTRCKRVVVPLPHMKMKEDPAFEM
jgi:hypothetical protein